MNSLFLLFVIFLSHAWCSQLDDFLKAIADVNVDLNFDIYRPKRSPSIDELLSRFDDDDSIQNDDTNLEAGDAWYQSFRAQECLHGGCSKKTLRWKAKKSQPDDDYEYYDDDEEEANLQDQMEQTRNDLSHEADYKLSKIEQDAVEQKLPKVAWPVRHNTKRSVDPMQAIKLKTSLRMSKHGYGLNLPSSILERDKSQISSEDILSTFGNDDDFESWKPTFETMETRKLLSVEEFNEPQPNEDEKVCNSKECRNHVIIDISQFDNMNQKSEFDRKLQGIPFDNLEETNVAKKGTLATLSDQLMNSEAFMKIKNFIKGKSEDSSPKAKFETKQNQSTEHTTTNPLNLSEKDRDVNIKLHMSVNATVLGEGKLPQQFHKNNTISYTSKGNEKIKRGRSKSLVEVDDLDNERSRRGVVFPILTSTSKRKTKQQIAKSVNEATDGFPLDEIITGKLTSQLVKTIFSLVKTSPSLKMLWPGLAKNTVSSPQEVQNFYAIRNQDNESEMHRTEMMLRQAMETINAIIEQQVRSRSCIPLRADLKAFYELILETQAKNNELKVRSKREASFSDEAEAHNDLQLKKKSRIVKKLLRDYESLPAEDQDRIANIKDSLLLVADELRDYEEKSRRRKRQVIESQFLNQNSSDNPYKDSENPENTQYTPQFLKLVRTAEMLARNSIKDSDLTIDFSSI